MPRPYVRPTARQRELLAAYVEEGTQAGAADRLGLTSSGFSTAMAKIRRRTGMTTVQTVYFGLRDGWLVVREDHLSG